MLTKLVYMKVEQDNRINSLSYEVMAYTHKNEEKVLVKSLNKENSWICI